MTTRTLTPDPVVFTLLTPDVHVGLLLTPAPVALPLSIPDPTIRVGPAHIRPDPVMLSFVLPRPTIIGGTGRTILLPRTRQRVRVFIHEPQWPRSRVLELTKAFNIDRSFERMGAGHAVFTVPRNDPQLIGQLLERGNTVVIMGDDVPPWVGTLLTAEGSLQSGTIQVNAQGMAAVLDGRVVAQNREVTAIVGSHLLIRQMMVEANARNDTGVRLPPILYPGPELEELQSGSQSLLQALNEIHDRTDYEWWIVDEADARHTYSTLYWGQFQGEDLGDTVHLWQGVHFSEVKYKIDLSKIMAALQVLGDFGLSLPLRNSVLRTVAKAPQSTQAAARLEAASIAAILAVNDMPSGIRNESVSYEVMTGNVAEMARRARRGLERPLNATEQFTVTLNRNADWRSIRVGNFVTVHATVQVDRPLTRVCRVVGFQPDEEKGEIETVLEVPVFR